MSVLGVAARGDRTASRSCLEMPEDGQPRCPAAQAGEVRAGQSPRPLPEPAGLRGPSRLQQRVSDEELLGARPTPRKRFHSVHAPAALLRSSRGHLEMRASG